MCLRWGAQTSLSLNWAKVQVTDQVIESGKKLHRGLSLTTDDSFDFLLTLLEHAEEHAVEIGVEAEETRQFRIKNYLLKGTNDHLIHVEKTLFLKELVEVIHYLEDGRCECCGQAMDKKVAGIRRVDKYVFGEMDNYQLVCLDCKRKLPNALLSAQFTNGSINYFAKQRDISFDQANSELEGLKDRLVLIELSNEKPYYRVYWMSGLGRFKYSKGKLLAMMLYSPLNISTDRFSQRRSRNLKL